MLEGTLGDFSLPDIFQLVALTKKTGTLTVSTPEQQGRVLFHGGEVSFAVADVARVALGARLYAAGLVNEEQITAALERKRESGADVLTTLVSESALDEGALDAFIREQIEDAAFELMRLDSAGFTFDASPHEETVGLTVSTEHLITEGVRRMEEWAAIREQIPSADAVLGLSPAPPTDGDTVSVNAEEWRLLALVDGRRTVRDLVELTGKGEFATSQKLAELVSRGFVELVSHDGEVSGPLAEMIERRDLLRRLEAMELGAPVERPEPQPAPAAHEAMPTAPAPAAVDDPPADGSPAGEPELAEADGAEAATVPDVAQAPEPQLDAGDSVAEQLDSAVEEAVDAEQSDEAAAGDEPAPDAPAAEAAASDQPAPSAPAADADPAQVPPAAQPQGVDRASVARELASLGLDDLAAPQPKANGSQPSPNGNAAAAGAQEAETPAGDAPAVQRLTRDEDVNKGLLLRLIDGVKGA